MTQRDGMGREVGGGFRMGNTYTPVANSCQYMAKPIQYCKVISLQKNQLIKKKNKKNTLPREEHRWSLQGVLLYMPV